MFLYVNYKNDIDSLKPNLVQIVLAFSPYLKENTTLYHYKDQLVNAV
jgi:hypothetical protein